MALPGPGEMFGNYRIDRQLGSGGMGVVHAATDVRLDREVALKVMWPELAEEDGFRQRFEREATTLARVDSSHIVSIYDHGMQDDVLYIVTQYVDGGDLSSLLRKRGKLSPELATKVCAQLADALRDAHNAGVVHRDVKPLNVLVRNPESDSPHVYLCDFGIARAQGAAELTATGSVTGSWAWMAPERADGDPGTAASDIYGLGCLLWACLQGGEPPYSGSDMDVALAHGREPVPQLPGTDAISHRLNQILQRSMAKHPDDRYRNAAQFRDDLLAASRLAADPVASARTVRKRPGYVVPLAVAAALVVVAGVAWAVTRPGSPPAGVSSSAAVEPGPRIAGDANGDGRGDLQVVWYRNDGSKNLVTMPGGPEEFGEPEVGDGPVGGMEVGDFDGDRKQDQLDIKINETTDQKGALAGGTAMLRMRPLGEGAEPTETTIDLPETRRTPQPFVGDFDGDGRDDLAMVTIPERMTSEIWVMTYDDGGFNDPQSVYELEGIGANTVFYAGDFDGDGADDIALRNRQTRSKGQVRMLRNDDMSFTEAGEPQEVDDTNTGAMTVGDVDGDRKDEIVHASLVTIDATAAAIYQGSEDGFSAPESWASTYANGDEAIGTLWGNWQLAVSDVDGDGRGDLIRMHDSGTQHWQMDVFVSTGDGFEQPSHVSSFDCGSDCENAGALVSTHAPR